MHVIRKFFIYIACGAVGFILSGFLSRAEFISFDTTIGVLDAVELCITIGVLFFLQNIVSRKDGAERIEKDIIIDALRGVVVMLGELRQSCEAETANSSDGATRRQVLLRLKHIGGALYNVQVLLEETPIRLEVGKYKKMAIEVMKVRAILTSGVFPTLPLDKDTFVKASAAIDARLRELNRFIFYINRL